MNIDDKLRQELGVPLVGLLKKFMDVRPNNSQLHFYTGQIVDNDDPDKLGRCKIRVYGVFDAEIPDEDLPWAIPDFNFIGSTLGSFIVPPSDTIVKVYFDNNDYHTPRYTTKVIETNNLKFAAGKDEDYPNTMVFFETDDGEYFKINRKTLTTTYRHASGLIIIIDKHGNVNINNKGVAQGNLIIGIEGNVDLSVEGDTIIDTANVTLKTPTGGLWQPNTVSKCFFTGAPHGGPSTGEGVGGFIEDIKGENQEPEI